MAQRRKKERKSRKKGGISYQTTKCHSTRNIIVVDNAATCLPQKSYDSD
jgi:hypothetical protein